MGGTSTYHQGSEYDPYETLAPYFFFGVLTADAQVITNLMLSNQVDRYIQILDGVRERAKATQKAAWTPLNTPFGTFIKNNEPHMVLTNIGQFVPDLVYTGFVVFDTTITNITTNSIFDMGRNHPQVSAFQQIFWLTELPAVYDVVPPFETTIALITNEARRLLAIETNFTTGTNFTTATNSEIVFYTNFTTRPAKNLMLYSQIAEVDITLYWLMGHYGQAQAAESNFFKTFDNGSSPIFDNPSFLYGSVFDESRAGVDRTRSAGQTFSELGINDGGAGLFTRTPTNSLTNFILGELVYGVTNSTTISNALQVTAGWTTTGYTNSIYFDPGTGLSITNMAVNTNAVYTNASVLIAGARPRLIILPSGTNTTLLATNTVILTGKAMRVENNEIRQGVTLIDVVETQTVFDVAIVVSNPFAILTGMTVLEPPDVLITNLPLQHQGDRIHLVWDAKIAKYGAISFHLYKNDIDERYNLLTNLTVTVADGTDYVTNNVFTNRVRISGTSTNTYPGAKTLATNKWNAATGDVWIINILDQQPEPKRWAYSRFSVPLPSLTNFTVDMRQELFNLETDIQYTNLTKTLKFYAAGHRVTNDTPSPGVPLIPFDQAEYDPQGSVFTNEGIWFSLDMTLPALSSVSTGTVQVGTNLFLVTDNPPTPPGEPDAADPDKTRGYKAARPEALIFWNFQNATN